MSQQLQITGGAKVRDLNDVIIGTSGVLSSLAFNVANGVPKLDSNAKILVSQLPNSVMEYQGTWNAATNTPTLTNGGAFNQGDVYLCNVAGTVNFGAGPISFIVGDSAIYSGSIWQRSGGATGSVTSVGLSTNGDSITIGSSPITTSGTITANFNGTNLQYVNGAGNLTTFPTLISSIGLSMPSAFSVSNSPLTANGTIAVTGAGYPSQYIRGDGTLADFPTSGGGGSSVSYYLNGGTSQGTIGGVTYYEMSKTADTGTGVDFPKSGDGLIVSFLTDAGDPAQLNIPAGNWNYEIYASMSANGGTPQMYAELYKYDGTTFTLIATSSNEILYDGVNLNLYTFAMTVPATTLALTDRLAVKLYATNSGGKTTTVHTQDSHLCQIITTFSTGITALNGLTAQIQYFATGTSGTDFNISSTTATHTFNIPNASATARGLITTGTQTIAGGKTFSGYASFTSTSGTSLQYGAVIQKGFTPLVFGSNITNIYSDATTNNLVIRDNSSIANLVFNNSTQTYTFPAASGTIALTSDIPSLANYVTLNGIQTITGGKTFTSDLSVAKIAIANSNTLYTTTGYTTLSASNVGSTSWIGLVWGNVGGAAAVLAFNNTAQFTYTFPATTGTIALTSNLSAYLPLTGGTLTGALSGTSATFSAEVTSSGSQGRFGGWATGAGYQGNALEAGVSGGTATLLGFNRTSGAYIPLVIGGNTNQTTTIGGNTIVLQNNGVTALSIASTGAATFSNTTSGNALRLFTSYASGRALNFGFSDGSVLPTAAFYIGNQTGVGVFIGDETTTNGLYVKSNGNVGIGTSSPVSTNLIGSITSVKSYNGDTPTSTTAQNYYLNQSNLYLFGRNAGLTMVSNANEEAIIAFANPYSAYIGGIRYDMLADATGGSMKFQVGGTTERMRITSGGNVIINGTTAAYSSTNRGNLTISGSASSLLGFHNGTSQTGYIYNDYSANLFQWYSVSNNIQVVAVSNGVQLSSGATSWSSVSDERLKNITGNIENAIESLMTLRTIKHTWKSDETNKENLGLIAQDVQKVFPQVIDINKLPSKLDDEYKDDTEYLAVRYTELIPVLVKAIQELSQQNQDLKARLDKAGL